MIPLDDAIAHVLDRVGPLPARTVPLPDAAGLVLAAPVVATELVPPFDNTAMDGFAVRATDLDGATASSPVRLAVVGTAAAGAAPSAGVGPGEAVRIMTGAPMPSGADAVVMVERTALSDDGAVVAVEIEVEPGNHVRRAGEDVTPGDLLFDAGDELRAGPLGVLASVGVREVEVHPRPCVGVVSTGDELVDDGRPLEPGQIRDSNRLTLLTMLAQAGFEGVDLGIAPDTESAIESAFVDGVERCDAILSSGGVSMGAFDYVKVVLDRIGDMRWMQIAIKPAKPFAFGLVGDTPVFGLPGNPVSSMVSFELLARPALRRMAGHRGVHRDRVTAIAGESFGHGDDGKTHFLRVDGRPDEEGRWRVVRAGGQGSHQLVAMARSAALAVVPSGSVVEPGDPVLIIPLV